MPAKELGGFPKSDRLPIYDDVNWAGVREPLQGRTWLNLRKKHFALANAPRGEPPAASYRNLEESLRA